MIKNYFDKQFELRYFEMNELGIASPTTILTLLEEAAAEHCHSIDYSLYQLAEMNIGWVLVSGVMQMIRYPRYKDKITIRTWLSKYSTIKGFRENIIYDEQENIIGRSRGLWIFFDINRRRPVQILDDIMQKWSSITDKSIDYDITKKIKLFEDSESDYVLKFQVFKFDTDMIQHVNNIRYLQWAIESVPDEIIDNYYLHSIDGRFIAEANYGQTIISMTKNDYSDLTALTDRAFIHLIKIEGLNTICATAKTVWRKNSTRIG